MTYAAEATALGIAEALAEHGSLETEAQAEGNVFAHNIAAHVEASARETTESLSSIGVVQSVNIDRLPETIQRDPLTLRNNPIDPALLERFAATGEAPDAFEILASPTGVRTMAAFRNLGEPLRAQNRELSGTLQWNSATGAFRVTDITVGPPNATVRPTIPYDTRGWIAVAMVHTHPLANESASAPTLQDVDTVTGYGLPGIVAYWEDTDDPSGHLGGFTIFGPQWRFGTQLEDDIAFPISSPEFLGEMYSYGIESYGVDSSQIYMNLIEFVVDQPRQQRGSSLFQR